MQRADPAARLAPRSTSPRNRGNSGAPALSRTKPPGRQEAPNASRWIRPSTPSPSSGAYEKIGKTRGRFAPAGRSAPRAHPYSIVIPPPNVTGNLHMGHALNNTLQDILARSCAHEGPRCALAARHGPRWHRNANGCRAPAHGAPGAGPPRDRPREVSGARLGLEGGVGRRDRRAVEAPRRLLRLVPRAFHARRGPFARRGQGVRPALSRRG